MKANLLYLTCRRGIFSSVFLTLITPVNGNADLLEEITVTAQKREENLQDVSVSVTAFSSDTLNDIGLSSSNELGQYIPGVEIAASSGNQQAKTFIRGSGAVDFSANTETTVGVYLDEVYLQNTFMHTMQTFDLERIEVLRGPQGTLYGRNATGGAINYITAKPTQDLSGYAKAGYGSFDAVKIEGAVSGGLTDTLAGRAAFTSNKDKGWMKGRTNIPGTVGGDLNATDYYSGRVTLQWDPADNLTLVWSAYGAKDKSDSFSYQHVGAVDPVTFGRCDGSSRSDCVNFGQFIADGTQVNPPYQDPDGVEENGDTTEGDFNLTDTVDNESWGTMLRIDREFESFTLTSITAYNDYSREYWADDDGSPYTLNHNFYSHETDGWSQELRFASNTDGPLEWLVGFYYAEDELDAFNIYEFNVFSVFTTDQTFHQERESAAVFGNIGYQLNEELKLTLGLRFTEDKTSMEHQSNTFDPAWPQGFGGGLNDTFSNAFDPGTKDSETWENFSWKLGIDYTPNENWLLYATIGTGYKSGGINVGFGDPAEFNIFNEENMLAYEVGFKSTLWDGRARFNMSAYYYDYEDLQVFDQVSGAFSPIFVVSNAPESDYYGFEGEFILSPVEGLQIMLGVSHLKNEFGTFVRQTTGQDLTGESNVYSPEWKFLGTARYEWDVPTLGDGRMAVAVNWSWTDELFHELENSDDFRAKQHWLLGGRVSWYSQNEKLEVALWGKNLSDTEYRVNSFNYVSSGWVTSVPNPPRTYGIEAIYHF